MKGCRTGVVAPVVHGGKPSMREIEGFLHDETKSSQTSSKYPERKKLNNDHITTPVQLLPPRDCNIKAIKTECLNNGTPLRT